MKKDFSFLSAEGKTRSHGIIWIPEGKVRAILQICHGMVEYIDRYDEFARYLNGHGYLVIGHDHLGHGKTATKPEEYGQTAGFTYAKAPWQAGLKRQRRSPGLPVTEKEERREITKMDCRNRGGGNSEDRDSAFRGGCADR